MTTTEAKPAADVERYDPRKTPVIVNPDQPPESGKLDFMPVEGPEFVIHLGRDGKTPFVFLDLVEYLTRRLGDYRDGWEDWLVRWERMCALERFCYFNDLSDDPAGAGPEDGLPLEVAAYLSAWLYLRLKADVVAQHGGKPDDYQVSFPWAGWMVDHVAKVLPEVDPRRPLPDNHPLVTHPGQGELVSRVAAGEAG